MRKYTLGSYSLLKKNIDLLFQKAVFFFYLDLTIYFSQVVKNLPLKANKWRVWSLNPSLTYTNASRRIWISHFIFESF